MLATATEDQIQRKFYLNTLVALSFLMLCRIISMWFIPLTDTTEARYGEIARKMLETGNWVTPQHAYGVPFWAKPPLSTWLSAFSMKIFGVNEFAVRFPNLLLSIGILWLVWHVAKKHSGSFVAYAATLVLASTLYFFLDAGTVMTDPSLIFCTTLSLLAFWQALNGEKLWAYVFFIGLGLGLLAKGPVAIVLTGIPLFFWVLFRWEWARLWKCLPWFTGTLIMLLIAVPWYVLAEIRTPGFLNYFIIGEHFNRFLVPGWTGDKYGMAHDEHWGMIWAYAVAGIFPWSIPGIYWMVKNWKKTPLIVQDKDGWMLYLFCCMIGPLLFFTFSSNIIYTYVFPSLPAFALFFAEVWNRSANALKNVNWMLALSLCSGIFFLAATLVFKIEPQLVAKTQKPVIAEWNKRQPPPGTPLVYWDYKTEFSAQFYSAGRALNANNLDTLRPLLSKTLDNYLVIRETSVKEFPADLLSLCKSIKSIMYNKEKTLLYQCPAM